MTKLNGRHGPLGPRENEWLHVRAHLRKHRYSLSIEAAAQLYPDVLRVAETPLLTAPGWMPAEPVQLSEIGLDLITDDRTVAVIPPHVEMGRPSYSDLVKRLAAPAIFENRVTYRLRDAEFRTSTPTMRFGLGYYFDSIDIGESVAHEYAAQKLGLVPDDSFRATIGNPVDPDRRPMNIAISTLTLRYDRERADVRFLLHWRDPAKVGHAGGLYQVLPVGIFQPGTDDPDSVQNDFSLWRCLVREYAEELLGRDEAPRDSGPTDYERWPFAIDLTTEHERGGVRAYCLGMGVDPLTLATDLLCVVLLDAPVYDRIFAEIVRSNNEGELTGSMADGFGVPFTADEVERLADREPMQAAGAAVLRLAWRHRSSLLLT